MVLLLYAHNILSCGIYTAPVSLVFGTAIPTSFSILVKMLVSLVFTASQCNLEANNMLQPHPLSAALCMYEAVFTRALTGSEKVSIIV